jgi:hypothetical protein
LNNPVYLNLITEGRKCTASNTGTEDEDKIFCPDKERINTVQTNEHMLLLDSCLRASNNETVWNELDYRVDVCRITKGAHIEHL